MNTRYGKQIVFVIAFDHADFMEYISRKKDLIAPPLGSQGIAYSKTHNYRYAQDYRSMVGHHGCEVEFLDGWQARDDDKELKVAAEMVKRK